MAMRARSLLRPPWARHLVALVFFGVMAVAHTWPLASAPAALSRHDNGDALLNEWTVAWVAHQLPRDPLHLFDANIFYPERNTLAFSEHLFVQGVLAMPLFWAGLSSTVVHNLLMIIGLALTGWTTYLVMARWTRDSVAAVLSGCLMAFNAHTLVRLAHLQAMHVEFLPLAVAALGAVLARPRYAVAAALAFFFVLQGLASNYLLVMTVFALGAAFLARPEDWLGRKARRAIGPLVLAGGLAVLLMLPFLLPYYWANRDQGLIRRLDEIGWLSATWRDYLATGGRIHYELWSKRVWAGGPTPLFPGLVAGLLTLIAMASGLAFRDRRARMWLAIGIAGVLLSFGPAVPGYVTLYTVFPLLQGIRAPVRIGFLLLAAVATLAGFGLMWLRQRCASRTRLAATLGIGAIVLATAEAIRTPVGFTPALKVPPVYHALALEPHAVVVEYPLASPAGVFHNAPYMLNSTRHWKPMVNGYSGFLPVSYRHNYERLERFPEPAVLQALVDLGVTHVVLHTAGRIVAAEQTPGLTRVASGADLAIYRLDWQRLKSVR